MKTIAEGNIKSKASDLLLHKCFSLLNDIHEDDKCSTIGTKFKKHMVVSDGDSVNPQVRVICQRHVFYHDGLLHMTFRMNVGIPNFGPAVSGCIK